MFFFPTEKARAIRLLILDVDGILTSGKLLYGTEGVLIDFHVHDGLGMKRLQQHGIEVAVITSRQSEAVTRRMQDLGITHLWQGQRDKLTAYDALKQALQLQDTEIACMGDDLPDLPLLQRAGLAVTVKQAPAAIRRAADWCTRTRGGEGAVRELADRLLKAQGKPVSP